MENVAIYIPKEASVKNIPLRSLSSSLIRKISEAMFQHESEKQLSQIVTCICPVELRQKEMTLGKDSSIQVNPPGHRPLLTQITAGRFLMSVVSSSVTAFKVIKAVLNTHQHELEFSRQETEVTSLPSISYSGHINAIIIVYNQIFLWVRKPLCKRFRLQNCPSATAAVGPPGQHQQINTTAICQTQPLIDASHTPQQNQTQDVQTPVPDLDTRISPLLQEISEEMPEQSCADKESQKEADTTSESRPQSSTSPKHPLNLESSHEALSMTVPQILQASSSTSEAPEAAGGKGEMYQDDRERLEAMLLPRAETCLAFDFEQLAQEERINHLRARLRQKEVALSIFNSKPTDQI